MKHARHFDIVTSLFVAVLLVSNIASSAKIVDWGVSMFGLRLAFDAGTLLFPISYIFGDILTEVYGFAKARRAIWIGFGSMLLLSAYVGLVGTMPGESEWLQYAGNEAYTAILGGIASGGILVASLTAYLFGELSNSYVLDRIKKIQNKHLWMRTIGSTLIGQGIDTVLFVVIACAFEVFPWQIALSLIVSNYIFKVVIEALLTPATYAAVYALKKKESL